MKTFTTDVLDALGPLGWVVHIGAGTGHILSDPWSTSADHIVLVEANPKAADTAKQAAQSHVKAETIHVLERVVGTTDIHADWTTYNIADFSSTAAPTDLLTLFPGLRETATFPVQMETTATLLARFEIPQITGDTGPTPSHPNVLILNVPGETATILTSLIDHAQLDLFDHIFVQLPELCLYEGSLSKSDVITLLTHAHFDVVAQHSLDPDLPVFHIQKNIALKKDLIAQANLAALHVDIEQLKRDNTQLSKDRAAARSEQAKIPLLETEIRQLKEDAARLRKDRDTAHAELAERVKLEIEIDQFKKNDMRLREELDTTRADQAKIPALETEIDELKKAAIGLKTDHATAHAELQNLNEKQCKQTQLRIADLKDLQDKYEAIQFIKRDQDVILGQLATYVDQALTVISPPATAPSKTRKSIKKTGSKS